MKADIRFLSQSREFWANVRTISQGVGYTDKGTKTILIPNRQQLHRAFDKLDLSLAHIEDTHGNLTQFGNVLIDYFTYRSEILNNVVRLNLMNKDEAEELFNQLHDQLRPTCPLPLNKQKAEKKMINSLEGVAEIGIDDFAKVELRVAEVKACEKVQKAIKLLKLTLDDGPCRSADPAHVPRPRLF